MIEELLTLGHIKKWKKGFVLTRKGQATYGESDPHFWTGSVKTRVYDNPEQGIERFCEIFGLDQKEGTCCWQNISLRSSKLP